jgi:hypothetical protein
VPSLKRYAASICARRLLKNPRTSRVIYLGQISVEGRRSIP